MNNFDFPFDVHLFFEQSGTFKDVFSSFGVCASDYDILNDFGKTDFVIDLFSEINKAYSFKSSIFDSFNPGSDFIFAFFPCTRFDCQIALSLQGNSYQFKNWSSLDLVNYVLPLHDEVASFYSVFCKFVSVVLRLGLPCIIENPYTQPHYLTRYFPLKPGIIDYDRRLDGDYYKKPTQYFVFNYPVLNNLIVGSVPVQDYFLNIDKVHNQVSRSLISPVYAARFIKKHIFKYPGGVCLDE